jgi:tetratricopeptide (TPR) repeat protein
VIRTFLAVLPHSQLWYNTSELLLIGVNGDEFNFAPAQLQRLTANPKMQQDLQYAYWDGAKYYLDQPQVFLAGFLTGPDELARLAGTGEIYRDDRPVLDYATSTAYLAETSELPLLDLLGHHLQPPQALPGLPLSAADSTLIEQIRNKNLGEIAASVYLRQAGKLIPAKRYEQIISYLQQAVAANPEHFTANRMLADALMETRQFAAARDHYAQALKIHPNDADALLKYATALQQLQDFDNAIRYYRRVLQLRPDSADAHNNLGAALAQRGRFPEALPHMQEAVRLKPGDVNAQRNLDQLKAVLKSAPTK